MSKLPVRNMKGEQVGEFDLADDLLIFEKGTQALHDAIVAYQANQRQGSASTRNKGEVAGSNKKPWKQKGTGRARAGYRQSPVWRGGGVAFGPRPRSYNKKVLKKVARLAFRRAFSEKVAAGQVIVLDGMHLESSKTRDFASLVKNLEGNRGALFVMDRVGDNVALASRNIPKVEVTSAESVNTYQIMRYPLIVMTKEGAQELTGRLQGTAGSES
ncbi:MAG: 50S ribosomal protein L4 [Spartobacteria bacterium]|nr:50S ribosomal protein L4 [Spartobacteria bacterium]